MSLWDRSPQISEKGHNNPIDGQPGRRKDLCD